MQSDSGKINNGITCVIITNRQISEIKSLKTILEITDKVIIVTNRRESPSNSNSIRIIYSSSQNYAYLRNLRAYYAETTHILVIDSDELLDDTFLKEIKHISYEAKMYYVNIKTFGGVKKVSMAQRYNPRIYDNREFVDIGPVTQSSYRKEKSLHKTQRQYLQFQPRELEDLVQESQKIYFTGTY